MPITSARQLNNSKKVVSTSKDHFGYIWELDNYEKVNYTLHGHSDMVTGGDFINSNLVVTSSYDQRVNFWKIEN